MDKMMIRRVFAISWIHGEFTLVLLKQGKVIESWRADFTVKSSQDFKMALAQANEVLNLHKGGELSVIYEAHDHHHELLQLPKMPSKDLAKVLARKANQLKPFKQEASWCYHQAAISETEDAVLLHILPQAIVDTVVDLCQAYGLRPKQLLPLSEVVSALIPAKKIVQTEYVVWVALFENHTEIFVLAHQGEIIFTRSLSYCGYGDDTERLVTDINRTLRYSKQQFHQTIEKVYLCGQFATQLSQTLAAIEADIVSVDKSDDGLFWAKNIRGLKQQANANFIPLLAQQRINKQSLQRWLLLSTPALLAASVLSFIYVETQLFELDTSLTKLSQELDQLHSEMDFYQKLSAEVGNKQQALSILQASNQNLPALLLNNIPEILPSGLVIRRFSVEQHNHNWQLSLEMESHLELASAEEAMLQLEHSMKMPPWNFIIGNHWQKAFYHDLKVGQQQLNNPFSFAIQARAY